MAYVEGDLPIGNSGFGGGDSWVLIILFALIFGWGNGTGFGGGNSLGTDFAILERKLDGVNNGICSLGYDQLGQMNGINMNIMQNGYETRNAINGVSNQLSSCCCQLNQAIDGVGDRIIDYLSNEKIQALRDENFSLKLAASQSMQNNYLISQLKPTPIPAFSVNPPFYYNGNGGTIIQ